MLDFIVQKQSFVSGEVYAPASKSVAQRAIAAACMTKGKTILLNVDFSDDVLVALRLAEAMGSEYSVSGRTLEIIGDFQLKNDTLEVGEAGLSTRMFIPVAGLLGRAFRVEGKGSILSRPMGFVAETLANFGLEIKTSKGFLPLEVSGRFKASDFVIDASQSSQLLTGVLMALPFTRSASEIRVKNLKSKPYIDLTIEVMKQFGIAVRHQNYEKFSVTAANYRPVELNVEGDWSGAAFWFVAAALIGNLKIRGLNPDSKQSDIAVLEALDRAGASCSFREGAYEVKKSALQAFTFDATDCPDLFPPLASLAVGANGNSVISGVHRLKNKESNRAQALVSELSKMGVSIYLEDDNLIIEGGKAVHGCIFDSHNDHRMAMTGAVLGLIADGQTQILKPECVAKSYPAFFDEMERLRNGEL